MDFINGKADPWGMKVNPTYKKISLPRRGVAAARRLRPGDREHLPAEQPGGLLHPARRAGHHAAQDRRGAARRLAQRADPLRRRPRRPAATRSAGSTDSPSGRASCSASSASATPSATACAPPRWRPSQARTSRPTDASLAAALGLAEQKKPDDPFVLDQADVRKSGKAYPGTMVVYTAAKTANLVAEDAAKVAQFIRVSTTEGQKAGTGNGELPAGFLPIKKTGATAKLHAAAQEVADAVAKQDPLPSEAPARVRTPGWGAGTADTPVPPAPDLG